MSLLSERGVTRKEAEVLDALAERLTHAEIASRLYVSERTVESHVSSLLRKLQAGNRREVVQVAQSLDDVGRLGAPALPAPLELLAESGPYVGRERERQRLRELWERASAGRTEVALVCGEAGIGKSRLVAELAAEAHRAGGAVLLGSCFDDAPAPYQPFVQALSDDVRGLAAADVRRRVGSDGQALGWLLPALGPRLGAAGGTVFTDRPGARVELLAAVHGYLVRAAEAAPVLLVLEDLHWATGSTRDAVVHLARSAGRDPVLVVATSRDTPPDLTDDLSVFLADLARCPSAHRVELGGLDEREVHALVASLAAGHGWRDGFEAGGVHAETGGNPL